MKPRLILCLALVLSDAMVAFAEQESSLVFQAVIKPSKTEVRVKEPFAVTLRVENPTTMNQTVGVMSCSWYEEWRTSNPKISWIGWDCTRNGAMTVEIPPGGAYTNELQMLIPEPISDKAITFRMEFTPIGSKKTFWSNEETIKVIH